MVHYNRSYYLNPYQKIGYKNYSISPTTITIVDPGFEPAKTKPDTLLGWNNLYETTLSDCFSTKIKARIRFSYLIFFNKT